MKQTPSKLEIQKEAGVIEIGTIFEVIQDNLPEIPGFKWPEEGKDLYVNRKPSSLMRFLGINPTLDVIVGHPTGYAEHTDGIRYTEGYNRGWYLLIKGCEGDKNLHKAGKDYYCCNAIIAPHNNNPQEGKAKINNFFELLEKYNFYKY